MVSACAALLLAAAAAPAARAAPTVPTVPLSVPAGAKPVSMPVIGLGSVFGFTPPGSTNVTEAAVELWLRNGGRAIHGAWMYCNQEAIGRGIKASGVPREDIFLMSMLPQWHLGYNSTMANFEDTLRQLQTDYVDLYMYHWPGMFVDQLPMEPAAHPEVCGTPVLDVPPCKQHSPSWKNCRLESWRAMSDLQKAGKIRALGTSNFEIPHLKELMNVPGGAPVAVNQMNFHVGYHDDFLNDFHKQHKIVLQAYSPLGGGALASPSKAPPSVGKIAAAHKKSAAQVALRFIVQSGAAAIPKAGTTEYQLENMDVFDWSLTAAEMAELAVLAHPVPGGRAQETPSMMCIDNDAGRMARCEYLD